MDINISENNFETFFKLLERLTSFDESFLYDLNSYGKNIKKMKCF